MSSRLVEPHVPGLDRLAAGLTCHLDRVETRQIAADDEPEINDPDRCVRHFLVAHLQEERRRHRIPKQVRQGPFRPAELQQRRMLLVGIESVLQDRAGESDGRTVGMEAGSDRIDIDRIPCVDRFHVVARLHLEQQPDRDEN